MVEAFQPPVYCYHEIVHNRLVVDRFRGAGRGLRRRRRRRARRRAAHALGPRLGARGRRRSPRARPLRRERGVPARHQGAPRGQGARREGLHGALRRPRGPRRSGRAPSPSRPTSMRLVEHDADLDDVAPSVPDPAKVALLAQTTLVAPRLAGRHGRRARAVPRAVDRVARRPLLRDHQPAAGAARARRARRRHRGDRQRELVEHHRAHQGREGSGVRPRAARRRARRARRRRARGRERSSASPPARAHRKTSCRRSSRGSRPATGSRPCTSPTRTSTSLRRATSVTSRRVDCSERLAASVGPPGAND